MRRAVKYLARAALFAAIFVAGIWVFAPWDDFGALAFEEARAAASRHKFPIYLTCGGVRREGLFPPRYIFTDLDVERSSLLKVTFTEATVTLSPLRSLLSRSAAFRVEFGDVAVRVYAPMLGSAAPKNSFSVSGGKMRVEANSRKIRVEDISADGEIKMTGSVTFDMAGGKIKISESDAAITAPTELNMALNTPMAKEFVEPASSGVPGEWRVKVNEN